MNRVYTTPTLYAHSSKGDVKVWRGWVDDLGDKSVMSFSFGLLKGKQQTQSKEILEGKNIGRSNETTHSEQAIKELESKMNKKIDSGYGEDLNNIQVPILPMLAVQYTKRKHNIKFPCIVQPKIDGVRMTCTLDKFGNVVMFTRKGKSFTPMLKMSNTLKDILKKLHFKRKGKSWTTFYLDGELTSNELTFQQLAGVVRNSKSTESDLGKIYYTIFDCFDTDNPSWKQIDRLNLLTTNHDIIDSEHSELMYYDSAFNEKDIINFHYEVSIKDGYEGTIIRNEDSPYKLNNRSKDLQKYKDFKDDEYEIIGYKEGTGTDKGSVIWECKTKDGGKFFVRPQGSLSERQTYFQNADKYIGSQLTIRYQELTDDGIPRFPVGITIRNYE